MAPNTDSEHCGDNCLSQTLSITRTDIGSWHYSIAAAIQQATTDALRLFDPSTPCPSMFELARTPILAAAIRADELKRQLQLIVPVAVEQVVDRIADEPGKGNTIFLGQRRQLFVVPLVDADRDPCRQLFPSPGSHRRLKSSQALHHSGERSCNIMRNADGCQPSRDRFEIEFPISCVDRAAKVQHLGSSRFRADAQSAG
jgi:hypothetical protein